MDYRIITRGGAAELEEEVRRYLAMGWQPLGRPFKATGDYWCQAITKGTPNERESY